MCLQNSSVGNVGVGGSKGPEGGQTKVLSDRDGVHRDGGESSQSDALGVLEDLLRVVQGVGAADVDEGLLAGAFLEPVGEQLDLVCGSAVLNSIGHVSSDLSG